MKAQIQVISRSHDGQAMQVVVKGDKTSYTVHLKKTPRGWTDRKGEVWFNLN